LVLDCLGLPCALYLVPCPLVHCAFTIILSKTFETSKLVISFGYEIE